jgi:hypothetical protein
MKLWLVTMLACAPACSSYHGTPLAHDSFLIEAMHVGATHVYWASEDLYSDSANALYRVPRTGGSIEAFAASPDGFKFIGSIAEDASAIYFDVCCQTGPSELWKVPTGQAPMRIASGDPAAFASSHRDLVSDGTFVYFLTNTNPSVTTGPNSVSTLSRISVDGGAPEQLASGMFREIALAGQTLAVLEPGARIATITLPSGALTTLTPVTSDAYALKLADQVAYWADSYGKVSTAPLAGGSPTTVVTATRLSTYAVDQRGVVYATSSYTEGNDGPFGRTTTPGGIYATEPSGNQLWVAEPQGGVGDLTLSGDTIYWFDSGPNSIMKARRP